MPTQEEVNNYLDGLRTDQQTAVSVFGADEVEMDIKPNGDVQLTIRYLPTDSDSSGDLSASEIKAAEQNAINTAETVRGFGAETQVHSDGKNARVIAVFRV